MSSRIISLGIGSPALIRAYILFGLGAGDSTPPPEPEPTPTGRTTLLVRATPGKFLNVGTTEAPIRLTVAL